MGLISTFKEVFENWNKWIVVGIVVALLSLFNQILQSQLALSIYSWTGVLNIEFSNIFNILVTIITIGILIWVIAGIYNTTVIKERKIIDFKEAYNFKNFILLLKATAAGIILLLPLIIAFIIAFILAIMISPIILLIFYILFFIWLYIISPAHYIVILRDSISEGLTKFYKVSLTSKYFVEIIKVTLFSFIVILPAVFLTHIPYIGLFIVGVYSFGVGVFVALYIARLVSELL